MNIINKELTETLRDHISSQHETTRTRLTGLVAFLSIHGTEETKQACIDTAQTVTDMHAELGIKLEAHRTVDGSIALLGFVPGSSEDTKTVLLYSHYDVQSAGDKSTWTADSWTLDERGGRWYGHGTADCKGNVVMHLATLHTLYDDALADRVDMPNIKLIVEGSKERGSAGLDNLIATRSELLDADVILIMNVGNARVSQPTLITTLRDAADVGVRVDAPEQPVHSSMFGGTAPDALAALTRMLDSLRNENGFTSIDGLGCSQRWEGLDYAPETFRADAGVLDDVDLISSKDASVSDLTWAHPSVIVARTDCPSATNAINAIPSTTMAYINFRIPDGVDPTETQNALENRLHAHAPWGVKVTAERGELANPLRASVEDRAVQLITDSLLATYGKETASMGKGASIPLYATLLEAVPGADIAFYGVEEPQARIHSADESVDPDEVHDITINEAVFLASVSGI